MIIPVSSGLVQGDNAEKINIYKLLSFLKITFYSLIFKKVEKWGGEEEKGAERREGRKEGRRKEIWYTCSKMQLFNLLDKSLRFSNLQIHIAQDGCDFLPCLQAFALISPGLTDPLMKEFI